MTEKIRALFIFEMLGRPPEHIKTTLEEFIEQLGKTPGIRIANKKVHEPHPYENEKLKEEIKDLFTTFAEVELVADNLNLIFQIVLNALPSSVEIIEPDLFRINNFELSQVLTELTVKLHRYDEVAKALTLERNNLINMLRESHVKVSELEVKDKKNNKSIKKRKKVKRK